MSKKTFAALSLIFLSSLSLAAELVVVESSSPDYDVGQILDSQADIVLGEKAEVMLIAEDGAIVQLSGPYAGPPAATQLDSAGGALGALGQLVGQAEADAGDFGGVRGGTLDDGFLAQEIDDRRTSPWLLHTGITGPQCVVAGADDINYWREQGAAAARMEITRVSSGENVSIRWRDGESVAAWPESLPATPDEMYLLRFDDQLRSTNLLLRQVPAAVADNGMATVAFLAANGCISQARLEFERLRF